MTVDEASRHRLFNRLEEVLGPEEAVILMSSLPMFPIDQLATKQDLEAMKHEILATIRHDISNQTRTLVFALVGVVVSISSVALFR
jgi:hypothetical protein